MAVCGSDVARQPASFVYSVIRSRTTRREMDFRTAMLWLIVNGQFRPFDREVHAVRVPTAAGDYPYRVIFCDTSGRMWLGLENGDVGVFRNERLEILSEMDGLAGGTVNTIFEDSHGVIWVGTALGLSQF